MEDKEEQGVPTGHMEQSKMETNHHSLVRGLFIVLFLGGVIMLGMVLKKAEIKVVTVTKNVPILNEEQMGEIKNLANIFEADKELAMECNQKLSHLQERVADNTSDIAEINADLLDALEEAIARLPPKRKPVKSWFKAAPSEEDEEAETVPEPKRPNFFKRSFSFLNPFD